MTVLKKKKKKKKNSQIRRHNNPHREFFATFHILHYVDHIDIKCRKKKINFYIFVLRLMQNVEIFYISIFCMVTMGSVGKELYQMSANRHNEYY